MPLLAAYLATLAAWLVENIFIGLAAWFTRLTIANLAYWTAVSLAIVGFYSAVSDLIAALNLLMPAWVTVGMSWVIPSNLSIIITYYFSVRAAGAVFRYSRDIITGMVRQGNAGSSAVWG